MTVKPVIYVHFGVNDALPQHLFANLAYFKEFLMGSLANDFQLVECFPFSGPSGKVWRPSIPCDGLIVVSLYPLQTRIRYEIAEAQSSVNRLKIRPVPVVRFGLECFEHSGTYDESLITVDFQEGWYSFIRLPGIVPLEAVQAFRHFFFLKTPEDLWIPTQTDVPANTPSAFAAAVA